jgi:hypothetical protein
MASDQPSASRRHSRWVPTLVRLVAQCVVAFAFAFIAGAIWAAIDGSSVVARARDAMFLVAAVWLFGGSTLFARFTTVEYAQHGIRERTGRLTGESSRSGESFLAPLAEGFIVALGLIAVSLLMS